MNIAFWLLIITGLILLWFCLSFTFECIGSVGLKLFNDAKSEITGENKQEEVEMIVKNKGGQHD